MTNDDTGAQPAGGGRYRVRPEVYRSLRRKSPWIMLAGMTAFGWLIGRAAHASEPEWGRSTFEADIPVMVAVVLAWTAAMVALLRPPAEVLAGGSTSVRDGSLVVWPLGKDMRIWNVISAPIGGWLGFLLFLPIFITARPDTATESEPPPEIIQVLLLAFIVVIIVVAIWFGSRSILHGVELTESHLIAHGFFRTQRFSRDAIRHAAGGSTNVFPSSN